MGLTNQLITGEHHPVSFFWVIHSCFQHWFTIRSSHFCINHLSWFILTPNNHRHLGHDQELSPLSLPNLRPDCERTLGYPVLKLATGLNSVKCEVSLAKLVLSVCCLLIFLKNFHGKIDEHRECPAAKPFLKEGANSHSFLLTLGNWRWKTGWTSTCVFLLDFTMSSLLTMVNRQFPIFEV